MNRRTKSMLLGAFLTAFLPFYPSDTVTVDTTQKYQNPRIEKLLDAHYFTGIIDTTKLDITLQYTIDKNGNVKDAKVMSVYEFYPDGSIKKLYKAKGFNYNKRYISPDSLRVKSIINRTERAAKTMKFKPYGKEKKFYMNLTLKGYKFDERCDSKHPKPRSKLKKVKK